MAKKCLWNVLWCAWQVKVFDMIYDLRQMTKRCLRYVLQNAADDRLTSPTCIWFMMNDKENVSDYVIELRWKTKFFDKRMKLRDDWPPSLWKWQTYMLL